jgi:uroporphyrin-III C-methyltransferase
MIDAKDERDAGPVPEPDADASAPVADPPADEADATPDPEASDALAAAPGGHAAPAHGRATSAFGLLALVVALLAVAGTGFLWWQYRQFYVSLADADAATADALERIRASQRAASDRTDSLDATLRAYDQSVRGLEGRLDAVPGELADLRRRIDAVQGGSFNARSDWLLAEAEYYLALANAELKLAANVETARAALRLADDRLREIADPGLASIRELLAAEIIALNGVRLVDTQGISFSLARLAERVGELPLRTQAPSRYSSETSEDDGEPGFARLWGNVKDALSSIVRVERDAGDVATAMSVEEERLARRHLEVELQIARLALIEREAETFVASLRAARAELDADFNQSAAEVQSAAALIDEMIELEIAPALPDISRSLSALRARGGTQ